MSLRAQNSLCFCCVLSNANLLSGSLVARVSECLQHHCWRREPVDNFVPRIAVNKIIYCAIEVRRLVDRIRLAPKKSDTVMRKLMINVISRIILCCSQLQNSNRGNAIFTAN